MAARDATVAVFGATGYTGRLIAAELRRAGVPLVLGGRDAGKLAALSKALGGADTAVADVGDAPSLQALARRARVLVNCVGPFVDYGEPVVRAAIAAGTHYVDTTGEQAFMRATLERDRWAKSRSVAVIPGLAFEIALGDCAAALAAAGLDPVERLAVTYVLDMRPSQGTQRTALKAIRQPTLAYAGGCWVEEPPARHRISVELPPPLGTVDAVSFPSGEVISIPLHLTGVREVRTYIKLPAVLARVASAAAPLLGGFSRSLLARVGELWIGGGTGGPNEAERRATDFVIAVDAHGQRGGHPAAQRAIVRGCDPYGITAVICRQGVSELLAGTHRAVGVVAPAMAFEPRRFLDRLAGDGITCEVQGLAS